jgi:hypothetical protein
MDILNTQLWFSGKCAHAHVQQSRALAAQMQKNSTATDVYISPCITHTGLCLLCGLRSQWQALCLWRCRQHSDHLDEQGKARTQTCHTYPLRRAHHSQQVLLRWLLCADGPLRGDGLRQKSVKCACPPLSYTFMLYTHATPPHTQTRTNRHTHTQAHTTSTHARNGGIFAHRRRASSSTLTTSPSKRWPITLSPSSLQVPLPVMWGCGHQSRSLLQNTRFVFVSIVYNICVYVCMCVRE